MRGCEAVLADIGVLPYAQMELAMAVVMSASQGGTFAAEMPVKRLLMLLELAGQGGSPHRAGGIDVERWKQIIQDLAS